MAEFKTVDADGNGNISFEEFRKSHLAIHLTSEQAREIFNHIDLNKNKILEAYEFQEYRLIENKHSSQAEYTSLWNQADEKG